MTYICQGVHIYVKFSRALRARSARSTFTLFTLYTLQVFAYRKVPVSQFQLSQFYPSPKLGQLFYLAEISVNISVNTRVSSKGRCATASGPPTPTRSRASTLAEMSGIISEYIFSECTFCEGRCWSRQPDYASIRPTRFLTVGSALSWASVLPFSWVG